MDKLQYKPDWQESKTRLKAWWQGEIVDRAVINITAPKKPERDRQKENKKELSQKELENYFFNPEEVITRLEENIKNTYWGGDAVPVMFPVSIGMVAILSNYLGCPLRFINKNTTWSEPIIEDWDHVPEICFDPDNEIWLKSKKLLIEGASRARNKYFVGVPDFNGPSEILSRLRDPENLAFDTIEHRQEFKETLTKINYAWYRYWQAATGAIHQYIGGYLFFMGIWSEIAATDLQSDFSCMVSKDTFDELILPSIRRQTEWIPRTIYHLDGPDAVRHLDSLLSLDKLTGIQWVPGAGAPPASKWISLLKRIQKAGKLIVISVAPGEVKTILRELNPEGLLMDTRCETVEEADKLLENVKKWT